ncbi:hypothetical protein Pan44_31760 [Caulifigura coniformis]|uniref:Rad50/SbcC-type AAA domain-containing protein n=2 Tax=Caulifigura coniformis TaxID=2527983 RepID=A0A517SG81_9PLAN|nr:hypothetical protein Pan44_31760 [Caulifigura coniformis]
MSHRKTVIEPSPGLTVLVGPNNCGKSALVAALQILCHNENSTYVKRHGTKECAVVVHTSEGHVIEWRRKTSPRYLINGTEHSRLGNAGIPAELHPLLRLPVVADDADDSFDVHFGSQKSPIFLLNSKAGAAAKFFASSSDAIRLLEMQQRHKEKVTEGRRQHQRLEADAAIVSAELKVLEATVPVDVELSGLETEFARLNGIQSEIEALTRSEFELVDRLEQANRYKVERDALSRLTTPPVLEDEAPLERSSEQIEAALQSTARLQAECRSLGELQTPPQLADEAGIDRLAEQLDATARQIDVLARQRAALEGLASPPVLEDAIALEATVRQIEQAAIRVDSTAARCHGLNPLTPPPELHSVDELERRLAQIDEQRGRVEAQEENLVATTGLVPLPPLENESELDVTVDQLTTLLRQAADLAETCIEAQAQLSAVATELRHAAQGETCPTCGQAFDADRLLEATVGGLGGHAHG